MIEVKSSKKTQTPGKARLDAMDGMRQTVAAIPKRKIGMAMMALFGLIAYVKTLFGGSEATAQTAPDAPLAADDRAAPICETENSSADNSGNMSYGNAELFKTATTDEDQSASQASPSLFQSPASSGLEPQNNDFSVPQPAQVNVQSAPLAMTGGPGGDNGDVGAPITPEHGDGGFGGLGEPVVPDGGNTDNPTAPQEEELPVEDEEGGETHDDPKDEEELPVEDDEGGEPGDDPKVVEEDCKAPGCENPADCGDKDHHSECAAPHEQASCDDATVDDCGAESCDQHNAADDDCFDDPFMARGDVVYGFDTPDHIAGSKNADLVYGGDGSDVLLGHASDDFLIGAAGDDTIKGGAGVDHISGGHGEDHLYGGTGNDILSGGADDDVLRDGHGADRMFGDAGNDTIYLSDDLEADHVSGGAGDDILDLTAGARSAHVDVAAGTVARTDSPTDTFDGIEIITASDGAEVFDLSGLFTPAASSVSETVFQIRNFGYDDTLVFADDISLNLSDLQQVKDRRDIKNDGSDFEARITSFDPEAAAEEHGRPGFRQDDQDALMLRHIELRKVNETGEIEFDLWISGPDRDSDFSHDFTS